ncbi:MAG: cation-translocating P-type ATPase [Planctomycetota bacterium]|nr:cation-translocating P-type ATPase [Planctomycetota bacterium]
MSRIETAPGESLAATSLSGGAPASVAAEPREQPHPPASSGPAAAPEPEEGWLWRPRTQLRVACTAGALLIVGSVLVFGLGQAWAMSLIWISLGLGMIYGVRAALEALAARTIDIDVLMVVGAVLAAAIGHAAEGALLLFLFTLAGALEALAMSRTKREIEALHKLMPVEAIALIDGDWRAVDPLILAPGMRIRIRPGERVPADATIAEGSSSVDQSTLTGESLPRPVGPDDQIFSGTVNLENALDAVVLRPVAESSLQKILNLVMQAREQREPLQRLIDRFGEPYTWSVLAASLAVMLIWWLVLGEPAARAGYVAITFLIVLSPCAIIIATPTATLTAIGRGARSGVLFKGGTAIERLSRTSAICFDKTGTLTFGRPSLVQVRPIGWSDERKLLGVAAALEADSTHPIAAAVLEGAARRGAAPADVSSVTHAAGRGVRGISEGDEVAVGSYDFVEPVIPVCLRARTLEMLQRVQALGQMASVVAAGGDHGAAAVLVISDDLRPGAARTVRELHQLGIAPVRMLTGDNSITAARIAQRLGIDEWHADLLPEDKVRLVREIRAQATAAGRPGAVAFVGDGVNDAPALAAADVSIAIGSIGSDAALESADIVLLNDDLSTVPWAIRLARRARAILKVNIAAAMSVIVLMSAATLVGSRTGLEIPMALGVVAHEGGTLFVVANALRLLWMRGPAKDPSGEPAPPGHPAPASA